MKQMIPLVPALLLLSCHMVKNNTSFAPVRYDSTTQQARFADDASRMEKLKVLFPVMDQLFAQYAAANHLPGISYGLVTEEGLLYQNNTGFTDLEKKIPVSSSSLFRIASMSKSFTCMAILKLRDEGKLNLDDPAYRYIPELKNLKYPTADAPHITIRHLMTHGAGFPEDNPWGDRQLADSDQDLMELIGRQISFSNPPGISYEYSNLGFALQGKIISEVSGMPYQQYIKKNILEPLGMPTATYEFSEADPQRLALGYRWLNNRWNKEALLPDATDGSWGAMGALICSMDEFARYMAFHLSAWPPGNQPEQGPVNRSSVREMHHPWRWNGLNNPAGKNCPTVSAYAYGLGWMKDCEGRTFISHSGGLPGFGSNWYIMPEYGIGIASFANRTYAPMRAINLRMLDTLIRIAGLKPRQLPPSQILKQRRKELMSLLPHWNQAAQSGIFAENFFSDYPADSLKKEAGLLFAKAGKIISVKEIVPDNQLRGSFIIEAEHTNLEVFFTLSPENPPLIQEYRIRERAKKKD